MKVEIDLPEVQYKLVEAMASEQHQKVEDYLIQAIVTWLADDLQEYVQGGK